MSITLTLDEARQWLADARAAIDGDTGSNDDEHDCLTEMMDLLAHRSQDVAPDMDFDPIYTPWRHGGWYTNVRLPSGASGCVSRNYADRKWRIVCDPRVEAHERFTYKSRDEAARVEKALVDAGFYSED